MLLTQLHTLRPTLAQVPGSADDGRYILKLNYSGTMNFSALIHHGVEFISQEGKQVCIVFTNEQGLTTSKPSGATGASPYGPNLQEYSRSA